MSKRIIIAEDNPRDREYISSLLNDFKTVQSDNANTALTLALNEKDPFLITDIQIPDMNGIELATQIWSKHKNARILFWSNHGDETYIRSLSKIIPPDTVYGYVLKNNSSNILLQAINSIFNDCLCWIDPKLHSVQARTTIKESAINKFEYDVLIDIALGLTDNMIAKRHYLTRRGAQNRIKSLYQKLITVDEEINSENCDNNSETTNLRARAISIALRRGLINAFELENEEQKLKSWLKGLH